MSVGLFDQLLEDLLTAHLVFGKVFDVAAEHDIGAAAGHVGGNGDSAVLACLRDNRCLAFVVLGVQDLMRNPLALEHRGKQL